jgi:hypothetical protein
VMQVAPGVCRLGGLLEQSLVGPEKLAEEPDGIA